MDETYGTYVDDECFDIHDYDDTDDDTDDGGRGNLHWPRTKWKRTNELLDDVRLSLF